MKDIINFDEDLAAIHSYLCADGYVLNPKSKSRKYYLGLRNTNLKLLMDFKQRFKRVFGLEPRISKNLDRCSIGSKDIHRFLIANFGSFHSYKWKMPNYLLNKETSSKWLRAFFDCEAWVMCQPAKNRAICLESVNKEGLVKIQSVLLDYFEIPTTIKPRKGRNTSRLGIFGKENLIKFRDEIGFLHEKKRQRLNEAIASFVVFEWFFPKSKEKLKAFVINKMRERAKTTKPFKVGFCSIVKKNLTGLSAALHKSFAIESHVYGPRFNSYGTKYYEFQITKKSEVGKVLENKLLSKEQDKKLRLAYTSTTHCASHSPFLSSTLSW